MQRLLLGTVWALTLGLVIGVGVLFHQLTDSSPPVAFEPAGWTPGSSAGGQAAAFRTAWGSWRVVDHLSAHHVAVIDVETDRPRDAMRIALILVEPLKADYAEMIVYFHRPGRRDGLPARRVQWSPGSGYVETIYDGSETAPRTDEP